MINPRSTSATANGVLIIEYQYYIQSKLLIFTCEYFRFITLLAIHRISTVSRLHNYEKIYYVHVHVYTM